MTTETQNNTATPSQAAPQYAAAFCMALSLGGWWAAMPFILRAIGGTEQDVGNAPALNCVGYLLGLLLTGSVLHHLPVKRACRWAAVAVFSLAVAICLVLFLALRTVQPHHPTAIWLIIACGTVAGAATAFYWPYLMSWVASGLEGPALNRRLGRYSGSWSSGALFGPWLGASLAGVSILAPMAVAALVVVFCFLALGAASDGSPTFNGISVDRPAVAVDRRTLRAFRWMARLALFCGWVCSALLRSQFALLFTDTGFSESQYGLILAIFGACNFLALTAAGRWVFWHFKTAGTLIGQGLLAVSLLLIVYARQFSVFALAAVMMGLAFGFAYGSHLYYGACRSTRRSARMAIHEITISLGVIIGSAAGGYLAENVGRYWPYWFGIAVCAAALAAQTGIAATLRILNPKS